MTQGCGHAHELGSIGAVIGGQLAQVADVPQNERQPGPCGIPPKVRAEQKEPFPQLQLALLDGRAIPFLKNFFQLQFSLQQAQRGSAPAPARIKQVSSGLIGIQRPAGITSRRKASAKASSTAGERENKASGIFVSFLRILH